MRPFLKFLARVTLSVIFIFGGYGAYTHPSGRDKRLPNVGLPESETLVKINGATMIAAGSTLALGILPKLSALTLIGTLIPTTLAGHAFWLETDPQQKQQQQIQFSKNLGLVGGLLLVIIDRKVTKVQLTVEQED